MALGFNFAKGRLLGLLEPASRLFFQARRYDEALRELRSQLGVHPDDAWASWLAGFVLIGKARPRKRSPRLKRQPFLCTVAQVRSNCWRPQMPGLVTAQRRFALSMN